MKIGNNRGGTLVIVIIVMAVLAILGSAFVVATTGEGLQAINHKYKTQAHYYARSGAYMGLEWLESEDGEIWLNNDKSLTLSLSGNIENGLVAGKYENDKVNLTFEKAEKNGKKTVSIESTGREGKQSDIAKLNDIGIILGEKYVPQISADMTIFASGSDDGKDSIILGNKVEIIGKIGTGKDKSKVTFKNKTSIKNETKEGELITANSVEEGIEKGLIEVNLDREYPLPEFPNDLPKVNSIDVNQNIEGNGEYGDITISKGETLNIDLSKGDIELRITGDLDLKSGGFLKLINGDKDSKLILFMDKEFDIKGDIVTGNSQLIIFYKGTNSLKFNGKSSPSGLIYAPNASITFTGSSDPVSVAIVGETVTMNGSAKSLGNNPLVGLDIGYEGKSDELIIDKSEKVWSGE